MDIKSISPISVPQTTSLPVTQTLSQSKTDNPIQTEQSKQPSASEDLQKNNTKTHKNFPKALPYAAGAVILAGLGFYLLKGKNKNIVNKKLKDKANEELKEELKEIGEEIKEKFMQPNVEQTVQHDKTGLRLALPEPAAKPEEYICTGFVDGKPVYVNKSSVVSRDTIPAIDSYKEIKQGINPLNDGIIAQIIKNKNDNIEEINKIIAQNTKDGHIDFNIMRKVAKDFMLDETGRGADRFHTAANILEQSYIKEYIKTDGADKYGLYNLFDTMKSDITLMEIYQQMPLEEAVNRIKYITYNDLLRCNVGKDMTKEVFFDKMFDRLIDKRQFKKYNDIFKIDGNFNDIMQINQNLKKHLEPVITKETLSKAPGTPLEKLTKIAKNEPEAHKAAYIMERAIINDFMSSNTKEKLYSKLEKEFLNNETLFEIYKKMPKEQAVQRVNAFRRFEIPSAVTDSDNEHTLSLLKAAAQKLGVKIN